MKKTVHTFGNHAVNREQVDEASGATVSPRLRRTRRKQTRSNSLSKSLFRYRSGKHCPARLLLFTLVVSSSSILALLVAADVSSKKSRAAYHISQLLTLPVSADEKTVRVDGNLDWELFTAFENTLADNPGIESVRFGSSGGYVFVARAMAGKILERQLSTHVETRCYSACTVAFVAGEQRTMSDMAELGFHQYKLDSGDPTFIDVDEELDKDRQFFATRGISDGFIQQVFNADNSDLWVPDKSFLVSSGVVVN